MNSGERVNECEDDKVPYLPDDPLYFPIKGLFTFSFFFRSFGFE